MTKNYPVNLILENKKCVVVGGGVVAERKVRRLLECKARVLVISPVISSSLSSLAKRKKVTFKKRVAKLNDLKGAYLVISATDDRLLNSAVSAYCRENAILVNVVDSYPECSFILPSILRRGELAISVSTGGISPALAKEIRKGLEPRFGNEYAKLLRLIQRIRLQAINKIKKSSDRKSFFRKAIHPGVLRLLRENRATEARRKIDSYLENSNTCT